MEILSTKSMHSKLQRPIAAGLLLPALMALAACGGVTKVDIDVFDPNALKIPKPIVEQVPITVGVHYDEKLRNHYLFKVEDLGGLNLEFEYYLGPPSIALFDPVFSAMFKKVVLVNSPSNTTADGQKLSGVLSLSIESFVAGGSPYIEYSMTLYAPPGVKRGSVNASGTGRYKYFYIPTLVAHAMRNAAADLLVNFYNDRDISAWLASHSADKYGAGKQSR